MRSIAVILKAAFSSDKKNTSIALVLWILAALGPPLFAVALGWLAEADRTNALWLALLLAVAAGSNMILSEIAWKIIAIAQERTAHQIDRQLITSINSVTGIEHFERPEYVDNLSHLRNDHWFLGQSIPVFFTAFTMLLQFGITIAILVSISPWLILIFAFAIPEGIANTWAERRRILGMQRLRQHWRRSDDMLDLIAHADSAKEVRTFGLADEIITRHADSSRKSWEREFGDRLTGAWLLSLTRTLLVTAFSLSALVVVNEVIQGRQSIGTILTFLALSGTLLNQVSYATTQAAFLTYAFTAIRRYLWITDWAKEHEVSGTAPPPETAGITFSQVGFTYPGTTREILKDVNFTIPPGTTVALIGDNGAGKSTIVKLLTRMYEPTKGNIFVGDIPLSEIDPALWRRRLSGAFQDHARFEVTAKEAIALGQLELADHDDEIIRATRDGGASGVIAELSSGYATMLGAAWPEGVDLSGGQWQKLAVARAMMRTPDILVLDEPTAALDAETEHVLFTKFSEATQRNRDTITVLVSHRFSTVRMADLILVVSDGVIAEKGKHTELMAQNGLYAELFTLQARAYQ